MIVVAGGLFGRHALVDAIRESGRWNRNQVNGSPRSADIFELLRQQL